VKNSSIRIAVIIGSTRDGRYADVIANWFLARARRRDDIEIDVLDLADIELPPRFTRERSPALEDYLHRLGMADAFVVITPEYNHSYPASLKAAIDWHFTQWTAKPVAFVSYGGAAGGRHAVLHLENVLTELHAVTVRDGLAFPNYFTAWQDGHPLDPEAAGYAKTLLEQLSWWAGALRAARDATPYPA